MPGTTELPLWTLRNFHHTHFKVGSQQNQTSRLCPSSKSQYELDPCLHCKLEIMSYQDRPAELALSVYILWGDSVQPALAALYDVNVITILDSASFI